VRETGNFRSSDYGKWRFPAEDGIAARGGRVLTEYGLGVVIHITAGAICLASGAVALASRKGEILHRRAGVVFLTAACIMAVVATVLAVSFRHWESVMAGLLMLYLVVTGWRAAAHTSGLATPHDPWAAVFALGIAILGIMLGGSAGMSAEGTLNGYPPELYLVFGGMAGFGAVWDLTFLTYGRLSAKARIARHLWRMCLALTIAAAAFFLGQPEYFPQAPRGTLLLAIPPLATLVLMIFWFGRVWLTDGVKEKVAS
jgi:hypothetical protein